MEVDPSESAKAKTGSSGSTESSSSGSSQKNVSEEKSSNGAKDSKSAENQTDRSTSANATNTAPMAPAASSADGPSCNSNSSNASSNIANSVNASSAISDANRRPSDSAATPTDAGTPPPEIKQENDCDTSSPPLPPHAVSKQPVSESKMYFARFPRRPSQLQTQRTLISSSVAFIHLIRLLLLSNAANLAVSYSALGNGAERQSASSSANIIKPEEFICFLALFSPRFILIWVNNSCRKLVFPFTKITKINKYRNNNNVDIASPTSKSDEKSGESQ